MRQGAGRSILDDDDDDDEDNGRQKIGLREDAISLDQVRTVFLLLGVNRCSQFPPRLSALPCRAPGEACVHELITNHYEHTFSTVMMFSLSIILCVSFKKELTICTITVTDLLIVFHR